MSRTLIVIIGIVILGGLFYLLLQTEPTDDLVEVDSEQIEESDDESTSRFTDTAWRWVETVNADGEIVTPVQPDVFQLNFTAEPGRLAVQTDCNSMMGGYELEGDDTIVFSEMATTLMYCENSQEQEFASMLGRVERYQVIDNQLLFIFASDEAQMVFDVLPTE